MERRSTASSREWAVYESVKEFFEEFTGWCSSAIGRTSGSTYGSIYDGDGDYGGTYGSTYVCGASAMTT